jgi:hypothetical protein
MNNYKLVMIFIIDDIERFFILENMHDKPLEYGRMQKKKTYFLCFWNEENVLDFFKVSEKLCIFNTESITYSVTLQPNIKWNPWRKTCFFMFSKKKKLFLKFCILFEIFGEKSGIFNIGSISYNVSLQPNIRQKYWKKIRGTHK